MSEAKLVQVGKRGLTPEVLSEIRLMLGKYREVRVKFMKGSRVSEDRRKLAEEVVSKVKPQEFLLRGNILVLSR